MADFYIPKSVKVAAIEWLAANQIKAEIIPFGYSNMLGYEVIPEENAFIVHNFYRVRVLDDERDAVLFKLFFADDLLSEKILVLEAKILQYRTDNQWTTCYKDEPYYYQFEAHLVESK